MFRLKWKKPWCEKRKVWCRNTNLPKGKDLKEHMNWEKSMDNKERFRIKEQNLKAWEKYLFS